MKLWPLALVLVACATKPPPPPPAPQPSMDGRPREERTTSIPEAIASPEVAAEADTGCNEDRGPVPDCNGLQLGQCGAAEFYACPAKVGLPAEAGLRPKVAARVSMCLARPSFDGTSTGTCIKLVEACVREAVAASCTEDATLATCKRELGTCSEATVALCAKYLTSLAPRTRANAIKDLRSQRKGTSCSFSWDLNGFPFCPFCPFQP